MTAFSSNLHTLNGTTIPITPQINHTWFTTTIHHFVQNIIPNFSHTNTTAVLHTPVIQMLHTHSKQIITDHTNGTEEWSVFRFVNSSQCQFQGFATISLLVRSTGAGHHRIFIMFDLPVCNPLVTHFVMIVSAKRRVHMPLLTLKATMARLMAMTVCSITCWIATYCLWYLKVIRFPPTQHEPIVYLNVHGWHSVMHNTASQGGQTECAILHLLNYCVVFFRQISFYWGLKVHISGIVWMGNGALRSNHSSRQWGTHWFFISKVATIWLCTILCKNCVQFGTVGHNEVNTSWDFPQQFLSGG